MFVDQDNRKVVLVAQDIKPMVAVALKMGRMYMKEVTFDMFKLTIRQSCRHWINARGFYVVFKYGQIENLLIFNK